MLFPASREWACAFLHRISLDDARPQAYGASSPPSVEAFSVFEPVDVPQ
jgi:hypothetical protein